MALWFPLRVNNGHIGAFYARRQEKEIPADRVCTYEVWIELEGIRREDRITRQGTVRHNYDRGAFSLVLTALQLLVPMISPSWEVDADQKWRSAMDEMVGLDREELVPGSDA